MREQRIISLKNHVGGENGSPSNPLIGKGLKSGVKRERNPTRLHKYSLIPIFMISGWNKEITTFQNRKGMRSVYPRLNAFSQELFRPMKKPARIRKNATQPLKTGSWNKLAKEKAGAWMHTIKHAAINLDMSIQCSLERGVFCVSENFETCTVTE